MNLDTIPADWREQLADEFEKPYFHKLQEFVDKERSKYDVFPPADQVFHAFAEAPYKSVRVMVLGQDPYHDHNQAHGLCFSVCDGVKFPPSLRNIFKELSEDMGCEMPISGKLDRWAEQGALLINAVLTVRAHEAGSHARRGWETFTDAVIQAVNRKSDPVVFVLWGNYAQKKRPLIDEDRHGVIASAHPSPLSARRGFFGSRPFSRINEFLSKNDRGTIDWCLPTAKSRQPELF